MGKGGNTATFSDVVFLCTCVLCVQGRQREKERDSEREREEEISGYSSIC